MFTFTGIPTVAQLPLFHDSRVDGLVQVGSQGRLCKFLPGPRQSDVFTICPRTWLHVKKALLAETPQVLAEAFVIVVVKMSSQGVGGDCSKGSQVLKHS